MNRSIYKLYFFTIIEIGLIRIFLRIFFDIRRLIETKLPSSLILSFIFRERVIPEFVNELRELRAVNKSISDQKYKVSNEINFNFLNCERVLIIPGIINESSENLPEVKTSKKLSEKPISLYTYFMPS